MEGVKPKPEAEGQEVVAITSAGFTGIMAGVYQYYNADTKELEPEVIRQWALTTVGPYQVGTVDLVFQQQDLAGQNITVPVLVTVTINGTAQEVQVDDGTLEVELTCPDPATVQIVIQADRHQALVTELEVVAGG